MHLYSLPPTISLALPQAEVGGRSSRSKSSEVTKSARVLNLLADMRRCGRPPPGEENGLVRATRHAAPVGLASDPIPQESGTESEGSGCRRQEQKAQQPSTEGAGHRPSRRSQTERDQRDASKRSSETPLRVLLERPAGRFRKSCESAT